MTNVLNKIIEDKKDSLKSIKKSNSLDSIENTIKSLNNFLNFKEVIANNKRASIISEIKKIHSYDMSCIVFSKISSGNKEFLKWISNSTR